MYLYHKRLLLIVKLVFRSSLQGVVLGTALLVGCSTIIYADDSPDEGIAILLYHRVGTEQQYPSTSVSKEQFVAHLDYLKTNGYEVVHLDKALSGYRAGRKRVAITFDDGFLSIKENAVHELEARSMPFTVFVNSASHERGGGDFMTWEMIRAMLDGKMAKIGSHGLRHNSMLEMSEDEIRASIAEDIAMIEKRTGVVPNLFSYPYGEAKKIDQEVVASFGFIAAFGQHSGVASVTENQYFLPRFSMNFRYGSVERLKTLLRSLPMSARVEFPQQRLISAANKGVLLSVDGGLGGRVACYGNGEKLKVARSQLENSGGKQHLLVQLGDDAHKNRRYRINCTAPDTKKRAYYWWKGLVLFGE